MISQRIDLRSAGHPKFSHHFWPGIICVETVAALSNYEVAAYSEPRILNARAKFRTTLRLSKIRF